MFEIMDNKIKKSDEDDKGKKIKNEMIRHLPQIYNALFPAATSIAIDARIQIMDSRNTIEEWIEKNKEQVLHQREIFQNFMNKFQSLYERIEQIS